MYSHHTELSLLQVLCLLLQSRELEALLGNYSKKVARTGTNIRQNAWFWPMIFLYLKWRGFLLLLLCFVLLFLFVCFVFCFLFSDQNTERHANRSAYMPQAMGFLLWCHFSDCPVNTKSFLGWTAQCCWATYERGLMGIVFIWSLHSVFTAEMESCHSYLWELLNRAITAKIYLSRSTRHFQSLPNDFCPVEVNEMTKRGWKQG